MITTFAGVLLLLGVGAAYRWLPGVPPAADVRRGIGALVFNFLLPALTFQVLSTAPLTSDLWTVPLTSGVTVVATLGVAWLIYARSLRTRLAMPTIGALVLASVWCNATYLGLPVVTGAVGEHVRRVPIIFDLLGMSPLLFTLGVMVCVEYGTHGTKHSIGEGLRQVAILPPFLAAVAGLLVNVSGVPVHPALQDVLARAGATVASLMILSVGLGLAGVRWNTLPMLLPAVGIKLVVAPLVAYAVVRPLIADADVFRATMLEAGMPTMMLTMVFADRYGLDGETLAQAILISTLVSMITLPAILQMLG